jgi:hypothetical protein
MKSLGYTKCIGPLKTKLTELFKSNGLKRCLVCGVKISLFNDSGWELFTKDGVTTQPVCKKCDKDSQGWELVTENSTFQ